MGERRWGSPTGKRGGFAPHADRPDQIVNKLRSDFPLWVLATMFMLICAPGYVGGKDIVNNMGDRGINSSIRAQWRNRVESIDTETKRIPANTQGTTMMSVKLPIC